MRWHIMQYTNHILTRALNCSIPLSRYSLSQVALRYSSLRTGSKTNVITSSVVNDKTHNSTHCEQWSKHLYRPYDGNIFPIILYQLEGRGVLVCTPYFRVGSPTLTSTTLTLGEPSCMLPVAHLRARYGDQPWPNTNWSKSNDIWQTHLPSSNRVRAWQASIPMDLVCSPTTTFFEVAEVFRLNRRKDRSSQQACYCH